MARPSGNGRLAALGLALAPLLALGGCRPPRPAPPAPPTPAVSVIFPVMQPVQNYYEYNGYLEAVETVEVRARVHGFLKEVRFREGEEVKQGDLLFNIDQREYVTGTRKAEADRLKANAELKRAKLDADRAKQLLATRAGSVEEYEQRVAAAETAAAVVMQAEAAIDTAKIQLGYTEIRAPIDGQISRTRVTRGNLVGQNEPTLLTTIVSADPIYVYFDAPERDLIEFQRSLQARAQPSLTSQEIPVEIGVATEAGTPHVGRIDFRENRVDTATGTVRIRGRIPNPRRPPGNARLLYPGLFARVRLPEATGSQSRVVLPEDALMTGQEGRFVYVVGKEDVVEKRKVTVGPQIWHAAAPGEKEAPPPWRLVPIASKSNAPAGESNAKAAPKEGATKAPPPGSASKDAPNFKGSEKKDPPAAAAPVRANEPVRSVVAHELGHITGGHQVRRD
ncbi:MAG TPA: efflux RND transporter periplasmic adaptor subunit, partial [Planctomycetia bacterium]|nr:efflux RND transporter periplasmic adaptor subunit [Planctomycetia bacterium]